MLKTIGKLVRFIIQLLGLAIVSAVAWSVYHAWPEQPSAGKHGVENVNAKDAHESLIAIGSTAHVLFTVPGCKSADSLLTLYRDATQDAGPTPDYLTQISTLYTMANKMGCPIFHPWDKLFVEDTSIWHNARCVRRHGDVECSWVYKTAMEEGEPDPYLVLKNNCPNERLVTLDNPCSWVGRIAEQYAFQKTLSAWKAAKKQCSAVDDDHPTHIACQRISAADGMDGGTFLLSLTELYIKNRHLAERELDPDYNYDGPIQIKLAACLDRLAIDPNNSTMLMVHAGVQCANELDLQRSHLAAPHKRPVLHGGR